MLLKVKGLHRDLPAAITTRLRNNKHMNTYRSYNMNTMKQIIKAIDALPQDYALRNESVKSVEMEGDILQVIHFPAMTMRMVYLAHNGLIGWMVDGQNGVWMQ